MFTYNIKYVSCQKYKHLLWFHQPKSQNGTNKMSGLIGIIALTINILFILDDFRG